VQFLACQAEGNRRLQEPGLRAAVEPLAAEAEAVDRRPVAISCAMASVSWISPPAPLSIRLRFDSTAGIRM
jgi:hypothetical protein